MRNSITCTCYASQKPIRCERLPGRSRHSRLCPKMRKRILGHKHETQSHVCSQQQVKHESIYTHKPNDINKKKNTSHTDYGYRVDNIIYIVCVCVFVCIQHTCTYLSLLCLSSGVSSFIKDGCRLKRRRSCRPFIFAGRVRSMRTVTFRSRSPVRAALCHSTTTNFTATNSLRVSTSGSPLWVFVVTRATRSDVLRCQPRYLKTECVCLVIYNTYTPYICVQQLNLRRRHRRVELVYICINIYIHICIYMFICIVCSGVFVLKSIAGCVVSYACARVSSGG